jgi:Ni/Fe-hydrogenase subunit HybB-like protein
MIDVGRPWLAWKIPVFFWHWNLRSVLLEVALCIMAYALVLWIELAPAFLERAQTSRVSAIRRLAHGWLPVVRKALPWVAALGLLLPTMHQSGLGTLLLLSGPRLHPLWNTIMLPLLFLTSCIAMGFGMVVIESALSARMLGRRPEIGMLAGLGGAMRPVMLLYLSIRIVDLIVRDQIDDLFALDWFSVMSLIEFGLLFGALALLREERQRHDLGNLFRASMLLLLGGALYRFDVFLLAFQPGANWAYFPNVTEILITVGLVAAEIVGYVILINLFPILAGRPRSAAAR